MHRTLSFTQPSEMAHLYSTTVWFGKPAFPVVECAMVRVLLFFWQNCFFGLVWFGLVWHSPLSLGHGGGE
jgi:putative copper export protein